MYYEHRFELRTAQDSDWSVVSNSEMLTSVPITNGETMAVSVLAECSKVFQQTCRRNDGTVTVVIGPW